MLYTKVTEHYNMLYKSDYVQFDLELVDGYYYIHVDILKKDENTRDQVSKTWIGLQEYLLSKGITEVSALIEQDNDKLKEFASSYGFKKELELEEDGKPYEIWIVELS